MKIQHWTNPISVKVNLDKLKMEYCINRQQRIKENGRMRIMAVSMATIPVIKGESAKQMLDALKTPTITKEFIEQRKREMKGIIIRRVK